MLIRAMVIMIMMIVIMRTLAITRWLVGSGRWTCLASPAAAAAAAPSVLDNEEDQTATVQMEKLPTVAMKK